MGFAIAISEAKPIIDDLMASGYVTGRPLVGIGIKDTGYGLFIGSVSEGSGAAEAGLKVNDMILEVDGKVMMQAGLRYQLLYPTLILSFVTIAFYLIGNAFSDAADPKNHLQ